MIDLTVLGAANWDISLFVERFAEIGGEVPVIECKEVPGGKGANVAVAAARILGGGRVALLSGLGVDAVAERQLEILSGEGVDTSGLKRVEGRSGRAYIVIDGHGRKMIHTLFGANLSLSPGDLYTPRLNRLMKQSRIVTIIDPPVETIVEAAKIGRSEGKTVIFAPGVRCAEGVMGLAGCLRDVDYIVANLVELECLTETRDLNRVRDIILKINPDLNIIATLGADGYSLLTGKGVTDIPGVDPEAFGLKVINTVGCGDAFLGVFCASKIQGHGDMEALRRANLAGALKATRGETQGGPSAFELNEYLVRLSGVAGDL